MLILGWEFCSPNIFKLYKVITPATRTWTAATLPTRSRNAWRCLWGAFRTILEYSYEVPTVVLAAFPDEDLYHLAIVLFGCVVEGAVSFHISAVDQVGSHLQ